MLAEYRWSLVRETLKSGYKTEISEKSVLRFFACQIPVVNLICDRVFLLILMHLVHKN